MSLMLDIEQTVLHVLLEIIDIPDHFNMNEVNKEDMLIAFNITFILGFKRI